MEESFLRSGGASFARACPQAQASTEQYQRMAESAHVVHGEREALRAELQRLHVRAGGGRVVLMSAGRRILRA